MFFASVLAILAIMLPVQATAEWLGGSGAAELADLRTGVWILKGALVATALSVVVVSRLGRSPVLAAAAARYAPRAPRNRTSTQLLAVLLVIATVLRLHALDTELWLDEIDTVARYARLPLPQLIGLYDSQNQHPLYLLLAKFCFVLFNGAEWSIRVPAAAFGVASLWATYSFASRLASRAEALLAVLILACSYHHVWFSQNARGYTAMLFFTLVTTPLIVRLANGTEERPARAAWLYAICMALAAYTHLTAVLVAAGHAVACLIAPSRRGTQSRLKLLAWPAAALALSGLLTLCLYALILPQVLREILVPTMGGTEVEWTSPIWMLTETLRVLGEGVPGGLLTVVVALGVLATGAVSYWRTSPLLMLAIFAPVAITAAAVIAMRHNLWPRFFFFAASFIVLVALRGGFVIVGWVLRGRGESVAIAGAVIMAGLSTLLLPRAWQPKQQFLAAARFVQEERAGGDQVVALGIAASVYRLRGAPQNWHLASSVEALTAVEQSARRTWIVYTFPVHLRALFPDLARRLTLPPYREVRVYSATVGGGEIHVLLNDSGSPHD